MHVTFPPGWPDHDHGWQNRLALRRAGFVPVTVGDGADRVTVWREPHALVGATRSHDEAVPDVASAPVIVAAVSRKRHARPLTESELTPLQAYARRDTPRPVPTGGKVRTEPEVPPDRSTSRGMRPARRAATATGGKVDQGTVAPTLPRIPGGWGGKRTRYVYRKRELIPPSE